MEQEVNDEKGPRCSWARNQIMGNPSYSVGTFMEYDITTKPVFEGLNKISIEAVKKLSDHPWFNRTLCAVNGSLVRIGVFNGEFHWHVHEFEYEFFLVLDGLLEIEIEGGAPVQLKSMEGLMVPKGIRHKTKAPTGATVLMVEQNTIVPTGS
jgi:mannose-6-phosphate isomerase-like protein (cupin superfamily)